MAGRFTVEAVFKAVNRVTAPVSRMQNSIGKFSRSVERGMTRANRAFSTFDQGLKRTAIVAVASLALIGGAMGDVITTGAKFEQTLVNAAAKFPGEIRRGTAAFEGLEKAARKAGRTTEFTATQSAEALNFLAMAGFSAEAAIASLPTVIDLATAGAVDLATASDIATDSLGAFNLLSKDAATNQKNLSRISDVLALTTVRANTNMEQLFETLKDAAPVGIAAGQSVESIAAAAGILANAGIKGTRAGTALKNVFLAISAPGSRAGKIMKALGIQTTNADGSLRAAADVLTDFGKAASKLPEGRRLAIFKEIFGKLSVAGAINLVNATKDLKGLQVELENSTGAVVRMSGVMRDTLQGRLNALTSSIEGVKISLFSMSSGPLAEVVERMTEWVRANEDLIATNIGQFLADLFNNFENIVLIGRQIAGVTVLYLALGVAIKTVMATAILFNGAMMLVAATMAGFKILLLALPAALAGLRIAVLLLNLAFAANPIGLVVVAIGALVALAAAVILAWDPVSEFFAGLWEKIQDVIGGVSDAAARFGSIFGFGGGDDEAAADNTAQVASPQERLARSIEEQRTTSTAEVTITAGEGAQAEVTDGQLGRGVQLQQSGAL